MRHLFAGPLALHLIWLDLLATSQAELSALRLDILNRVALRKAILGGRLGKGGENAGPLRVVHTEGGSRSRRVNRKEKQA